MAEITWSLYRTGRIRKEEAKTPRGTDTAGLHQNMHPVRYTSDGVPNIVTAEITLMKKKNLQSILRKHTWNNLQRKGFQIVIEFENVLSGKL